MYQDAIDALLFIADTYRKRSRYKRHSQGLRRAYANRAVGLEKAIKVLRGLDADARVEDYEKSAELSAPLSEAVGEL